jgi:hypothetical protein
LTPGQLAQMRAARTTFHTELFALSEAAKSAGHAWTRPSPGERSALQAMLLEDLRSTLTDVQRPELERRAALLDPR